MIADLERTAAALDATDPAPARDRFAVTGDAYLAGNSLGLMPLAAVDIVAQRLEQWRRVAVEAWFEEGWLRATDDLAPAMARIVGASPACVAITGTLTTNVHLLLAALYRPTSRRFRIAIDADAFPSDRYAVESHVAWHGFAPDETVVDSLDAIDERTAVVLSAGVSYHSGAVADIAAVTARAHAAGALALFDLAHAAGNVPLELDAWGVDAAAWCGYKYLNGGPGAPAAIFVHERHHDAPRLAGWWGVASERRFRMERTFVPAAGAAGFVQSTPSILALAPLAASLAEFDRVGMSTLRARSARLTGFLAGALARAVPSAPVTPADGHARGCQLSLHVDGARARCARLRATGGVVCDFREPDVLRFAPVPLYTSYAECARAAIALAADIA